MTNASTHSLPALPGIYIFKDAKNTILYIGKAKSLKKRVASYFAKAGLDWKIDALLEEYAVIEHIVTVSEHEALLLEAQLIQQYQPKFNTLLKSGNPFIYLLFTAEETPDFKVVRTKKEKGKYFGPFLKKHDARQVYDYLVRTFRLYRCNKKLAHGCLDYHIGRCVGTCLENFDIQEYLMRIELAQAALEGNHKQFLATLKKAITQYTLTLEFEKARYLNNYLQNFDAIFATLKTKYTDKKYEKEVEHATTPATLRQALTPEERIEAAATLQQLLHLTAAPKTIDCFDISHFQSTYIVGSCVRFTDGAPDKQKFRRFKIKTLTEQNDYAALQEIVKRRYRVGDFPDVIMIDGGKGQLSAAQAALKSLLHYGINGNTPALISIAKREETIFAEQLPAGYKLHLSDAMGRLLIGLRDYAHHFAISYHKLLRNKNLY